MVDWTLEWRECEVVKENIDRERPTQGGKIGRIVGLSRGMRWNKRETRRKKTYTRKGKWLG